MSNGSSSYEIKLPLFEGPFDLLLFFIERDELDIYDIPIAKITHDFLEYIKQMEQLNVEVASEFILVAATLMRIKAKMLLPRPVMDEQGQEIDPREELVRHLLEYKKYKEVVQRLILMEEDRQNRESRGNLTAEIHELAAAVGVESELQDLDLYKLLKVFHKVMHRYEWEKARPVHQVIQYPYSIEVQKQFILDRLKVQNGKWGFAEMVSERPERIWVIYNFLSILELLQLQLIKITIGEGFNNFWIEILKDDI